MFDVQGLLVSFFFYSVSCVGVVYCDLCILFKKWTLLTHLPPFLGLLNLQCTSMTAILV